MPPSTAVRRLPPDRERFLFSLSASRRWTNGDAAGTRDELISEVVRFGKGDTPVP